MATIITREVGATAKGSPLTNAELDANFVNLNTNKLEAFNIIPVHGVDISTDVAGNVLIDVKNFGGNCKNITSVTIPKGTPVYQTGVVGVDTVTVAPADAADPLKMPAIGVAGENLAADAEGDIVYLGNIKGVNTSAFGIGDEIYVAAGGGYTNVRPANGSGVLIQFLGVVNRVSSTNGSGIIFGTATAQTQSLETTNSVQFAQVTVDNLALDGNTLSATGNLVLAPTGYVDAGAKRIANLAEPTQSSDAATKQYVDAAAEGLLARPAVRAATTGNLAANYNNGVGGVGATLTGTANGAFPLIDGVEITTTNGGRGVLVRAQTNAAHNGRYNLTDLGSGTTSWVLTRCGLCDQASEIPGSYTFVQAGTQYANTGWVQTVADPATFTVGTDAINVVQFSGAGTFTAGTGLTLTGTEFALANTTVAAGSYGSSTQIPQLVIDAQGRVTSASNNSITVGAGDLTVTTSGTGLSGSGTFNANSSSNQTITITSNATSANTVNTLIARDGSGNFSAGTITATLVGNSSTATKWATARTISLIGDITSTAGGLFDGTSDFTVTTALSASGVAPGTYGSTTQIPQLVIDSKGRVTAASTFSISVGEGVLTVNTSGTGLSGSGTFNANSSSNQTVTISSNATSANTGGAIVARDASGNFSAGTITATTGAFTTLTTSSTVTLSGGTANGVAFLNTSKVLTTGSALTFDGTNLATTGTVTSAGASNSGNLAFTGTGNRITGDFSNATIANRVGFQSSTVNGNTDVQVLPNGTAVISGIRLNNNSDLTNAGYVRLSLNTTEASLAVDRNSGSGTYLPLVFNTGGSERVRIDTSGRVFVGTTSQLGTSLAAVHVLQAVNPAISIGASTTPAAASVSYSGIDAWAFDGAAYVAGGTINFRAAEAWSTTNHGSDIQFRTTGSGSGGALFEAMRIASTGNVGIGTSTPGEKLTVNGSLYQYNNYAGLGAFNAGGGNTPPDAFGVAFSTNITNGQAEANIWNTNDPALYGTTGILFTQRLTSTTRRDLMFLRHDGNVGVGTSSPTAKLQLSQSSTTAYGFISNTPTVGLTAGNFVNMAYFANGRGASNDGLRIVNVRDSTGSGIGNWETESFRIRRSVDFNTEGGVQEEIVFGVNLLAFNTGGIERARISASGGFSVGTTADPGVGAIFATGNITAYYSDDRLKTKFGNIENALDKVDQLSGFYYEANETAQALGYTPKREVGVSAQQVQAVMPEVVSPAPIDQQYLTVDYERLVPLLIEAIKELRAEVKALKGV